MPSCEEEIATIEGLDDAFCEPVEIYNLIDYRASKGQPLFLQRCLSYKQRDKFKGRVQMEVVLPVSLNTKVMNEGVFPVCVLLAKEVTDKAVTESVYRFGRARILYTDTTRGNHVQASFMLPKMEKLSELDTASLSVMFISSAKLTPDCMDLSAFPSNVEGDCLVGKVPIDFLSWQWTDSASWSLGETADTFLSVDLDPYYLKSSHLEAGIPSFGLTPSPGASDTLIKQLQVEVSAWEIGVTERNVYDSYAEHAIPSGCPNLVRLRSGNVVFNYTQRDKKLLTTEVTEDFACPFCLMKCVNFKGLECHLTASHDMFNFEFSVTKECQSVNVSPKSDTWSPKIIGHGVDPQNRAFLFCAKSLRRRKSQTVVRNATNVLDLKVSERQCKTDGHSHTHADPDCLQSLPGSTEAPPTTPQDDRTDKPVDSDCVQSVPRSCLPPPERLRHDNAFCGQDLNDYPDSVQSAPELQSPPPAKIQHSETRNVESVADDSMNPNLMQEGRFFHSKSGQPMTLEGVLSDHNSEDEVDYDLEDIEDRRMLADFSDVSKDEKHVMHLWNSFIRRNRIRFMCHINWASKAFTKLHGRDFVQEPTRLWCWRLFMIKLWNQGLLDGKTMSTCNIILDEFRG
ncbi:PREDICTED: polycomb group protein EMBRYONIC FLOWER 2-like [Ipomoea nil]|uniref:polycomb group protein EMBRYONIC FLOWER 2-like n=1 Tax=Ipomoea nil TaxID=35883 RepID=UPI0009008CF0|nr:PREDICTED: polycomb group protein EMBRYONIC FLOWER 2-like [Ipomoea nil]